MNFHASNKSVNSTYSTKSSRKISSAFPDFRNFSNHCQGGEETIKQTKNVSLSSSEPAERFRTNFRHSDGEILRHNSIPYRRFSVPEKDYAILRQCTERRKIEIIAEFDRNTDPYRSYMQSLICYDIAPSHSAIVLLDNQLTMRKALAALHQSGHETAIVVDSRHTTLISILTMTDFLRIISLTEEEPDIVNITIEGFCERFGKRIIVAGPITMSVWDALRLLNSNRVHRIPIYRMEESTKRTDVQFLLSLRNIFVEIVFKLVQRKHSVTSNIMLRTIEETRIGCWGDVRAVSEKSSCKDTIEILLTTDTSCVGVVNDSNRLVGKICKKDIVNVLAEHSYCIDVFSVAVKDVYKKPTCVSPKSTIYEAIGLLIDSDDPCLFATDAINEKPLATITFYDIAHYIVNTPQVYQKQTK